MPPRCNTTLFLIAVLHKNITGQSNCFSNDLICADKIHRKDSTWYFLLDRQVGRGVVNRCGWVSRQRCWKNVPDTGEPAAGTDDESVPCVDDARGGDLLTNLSSSMARTSPSAIMLARAPLRHLCN